MGINAPRGTVDILPPVSLLWQYVEKKAGELFKRYNYDEIRIPIFEYTELFQRGIGEITDIVEKEMYTFKDKGGRSLTLRPEGTASVMRSFLENKIYGQTQPTKYYYMGPMFRYERPQAGRYRQFHQLGVEVIGADNPAIDAEVIAMGMNLMEELGLNNLELLINSIGCVKCRGEYLKILKDYLYKHYDRLCKDCKNRLERNPLRVLDCKNESCSLVIKDAPKIVDYLCNDCKNHFDKLKEYLDILNIDYKVDPTLVRGLDYYTNTAFEVKYKGLGAQDTVFAGGRYNGLAEEIGNKSIPGIGFAIGLERLIIIMEKQGIDFTRDEGIDLYITTIGEQAKKESFKYVNNLRKAGFRTCMDYLNRSVKSQMKAADKLKAKYTIIIGEEELKKGLAIVKNMETGDQQEIALVKLIDEIQMMM
jgi:histidyl-tRNA synthetase